LFDFIDCPFEISGSIFLHGPTDIIVIKTEIERDEVKIKNISSLIGQE